MMSFAHSKPWQICNGKLPYTQIFWGESSPGLCEFLRPEFPDGNSNGSHALMWDTNHIVSLITQWPDIIRHSRHSNSYWNSVTWIGKSEYCMDLAALHLEPWTFLGFPTTTTQACACCSSPVHGNFDAIRTSQSSWTWIYIYISIQLHLCNRPSEGPWQGSHSAHMAFAAPEILYTVNISDLLNTQPVFRAFTSGNFA